MNDIQRAAAAIRDADAVLIGASNGLSIAEGYNIFADNDWFRENFGDFTERYGIRNVLEGCFYQYPTPEEKWAWWSRLSTLVTYSKEPSQTMLDLAGLCEGKDTFVLTTNGEGHFVPAGFAPETVFALEGDFTKNRCARHLTQELFDNRDSMVAMAAAEVNGRVPSELVPTCPCCGGPMDVNMADGQEFFQSVPWQAKQQALQEFAQRNHGKSIAMLELGVGWRNQLVKGPMYQLAAMEPNATYIVFNMGELLLPPDLKGEGLILEGDIAQTIAAVAREV